MLRKLIIAFLALAASAAWASEIPKLTNPVNDYANILSASDLADLNSKLKKVSITYPDNPQVMVLTVPKLPAEGIDQYANDVYRSWGVGQKGKDNGVLLVLAPNDRRVRIEVGYGLEGVIPDALSNQIIQNMKPYLKSKDWSKAVNTAVDQIVASLPKEAESGLMTEQAPKALAFTPPVNKTDPKVVEKHESNVGVLLLFFAVMGLVAYTIYRSLRRKVETVEVASKSYSSYTTKPHPNTTPRYRTTSSPSYSSPKRSSTNSFNDGLTTGLIVGSLSKSSESPSRSWRDEDSSNSRSSSRSDDSWSSRSSSDDTWTSSSSSSDSYSGGGGDSGGGGSSDSW